MVEIRVNVTGERAEIPSVPVIAAGSAETVELVCAFSDDWDTFGLTGYFVGQDGVRYTQVFSGNRCVVPHEALAAKGWLHFSVAGVKSGKRLVTEETILRIMDSSYGEATGTTPPTPTQYEQLEAEIAALEAKAGMLSVVNGELCISYEESDT